MIALFDKVIKYQHLLKYELYNLLINNTVMEVCLSGK